MDGFAVLRLTKEVVVEAMGQKMESELSWADGMIGVMVVFDSEEKAKEYADDYNIMKLNIGSKKEIGNNGADNE